MTQSQTTAARLFGAYVTAHLHGGKRIDGHIDSNELSTQPEAADMLTLTKRADYDDAGVGTVYLIPFASILFIEQVCE